MSHILFLQTFFSFFRNPRPRADIRIRLFNARVTAAVHMFFTLDTAVLSLYYTTKIMFFFFFKGNDVIAFINLVYPINQLIIFWTTCKIVSDFILAGTRNWTAKFARAVQMFVGVFHGLKIFELHLFGNIFTVIYSARPNSHFQLFEDQKREE